MTHLHFEWVAIEFASYFRILQRHSDGFCGVGDYCDNQNAAVPINGKTHLRRSSAMCHCTTDSMSPILEAMENYACGKVIKRRFKNLNLSRNF